MGRVVVIGGANLDVKARTAGPVEPATSNPGTTTTSPGGVGRNIAEVLARLGTRTHLVTAVGDDAAGEALLAATREAGVDVSAVRRVAGATGSYTAVLDPAGELVVAVADTGAVDALTPQDVRREAGSIAAADLLVLDGNLSAATLTEALDLAAGAGVPVLVEPVSAPKARRLPLAPGPPGSGVSTGSTGSTGGAVVHTLTPNAAELAALTGRPTGTDAELAAAVLALHERGVLHVWVRLGPAGSLLSTARGDHRELALLDTVPGPVVDVTGAGDAMTAAYVHALVGGATPLAAARLGHRAAAATVAVAQTVRPDLAEVLAEVPRRPNERSVP